MPILDPLGKVYQRTGLWVPQPLRMVQRRCYCIQCDFCEGRQPAAFEVTTAGIVNGGGMAPCYECDELNDTFILPFTGLFGDENACWWEYEFPSSICVANRILLVVNNGTAGCSGEWGLYVLIGVAAVGTFEKCYGSNADENNRPDCTALSNESIPFNASILGCDFTSATCLVTAL